MKKDEALFRMTRHRFLKIAAILLLMVVVILCARSRRLNGDSTPGSITRAEESSLQSFMALGKNHLPKQEKEKEKAPVCIPCGQKGGEGKGNVPPRPPPSTQEEPYQHITGRGKDWTLPHEKGVAVIAHALANTGWVMMTTGLPYQQIRCHVNIDENGANVEHISGAIELATMVRVEFDQPPPPMLKDFGPRIRDELRDIARLRDLVDGRHEAAQELGRFQIVSANGRIFVLVPKELRWTSSDQEDVTLRVDQSQRIIHWESIKASGKEALLHANRFVWFPEYSNP